MSKAQAVFEEYVPATAAEYCLELWNKYKFDFKITRSRATKLGDYRYDFNTGNHRISVNHDLNPYAFLITYIHEVAHKVTFDKHQNRVSPHGKEWKLQFMKLMIPILKEEVFPFDILAPLAKHMKNPMASSVRDPLLQKALSTYDKEQSSTILQDIQLGQKFLFKQKAYRKIETKRTRSVCEHVDSGKRYLIPDSAQVSEFKNQN